MRNSQRSPAGRTPSEWQNPPPPRNIRAGEEHKSHTKITTDLSKIISAGLYYYEMDLWVMSTSQQPSFNKIKTITTKEFSLTLNQSSSVNREAPPAPPLPLEQEGGLSLTATSGQIGIPEATSAGTAVARSLPTAMPESTEAGVPSVRQKTPRTPLDKNSVDSLRFYHAKEPTPVDHKLHQVEGLRTKGSKQRWLSPAMDGPNTQSATTTAGPVALAIGYFSSGWSETMSFGSIGGGLTQGGLDDTIPSVCKRYQC